MTQTVAIIDYGMGNLHSASKALELVAARTGQPFRVQVTAEGDEIRKADRVVLPGVGAMRDCMGEIRRLQLDDVVREVIKEKPFLGICVGMQAMMAHSEENAGVDCLDIFPGQVRFFGNPLVDGNGEVLKVPHMGWNQVRQTQQHPLWRHIPNDSRFYFVHSFYVDIDDQYVTGTCTYGKPFAATVGQDNIFAVQFHPEKSATCGLQLLENFLTWRP